MWLVVQSMTTFDNLVTIPTVNASEGDTLDYKAFINEVKNRLTRTPCDDENKWPNFDTAVNSIISKSEFDKLRTKQQRRMLMACATQASFSQLLTNNNTKNTENNNNSQNNNNGHNGHSVPTLSFTEAQLSQNLPSLGEFLEKELNAISAPTKIVEISKKLNFSVNALQANAFLIILLNALNKNNNNNTDITQPFIAAVNFFEPSDTKPINQNVKEFLNSKDFEKKINLIYTEFNRKRTNIQGFELLLCCYKFFGLNPEKDVYTNEIYLIFLEKLKSNTALYDKLLDVHSTFTILLQKRSKNSPPILVKSGKLSKYWNELGTSKERKNLVSLLRLK